MPHTPAQTRRAHGALVIALIAVGTIAASGLAYAEMREFTGHISQVTASQLVVDNRMGDQLTFVRSKKTRVRGAKNEWTALQIRDHVTVHWSFEDKPRQARRVVVLSAR